MRRRRLGFLAGGMMVSTLWPSLLGAQQAAKSYRIGYLALLPGEDATLVKPFLQRLTELGYSESRNMVFDYRSAEGRPERLPQLAMELVDANPAQLDHSGRPALRRPSMRRARSSSRW
jgi:putative tryptophan/tyrosine transport system substrate-binding protein